MPRPLGGGNVFVSAKLEAAGGEAARSGVAPLPLTEAHLQPVVAEAVRRWTSTGLTGAERPLLGRHCSAREPEKAP